MSGQAGYTYTSLRPYVAISLPGCPAGAIYENVQDSYGMNITARQLLTDFGRTDKLVEMARVGPDRGPGRPGADPPPARLPGDPVLLRRPSPAQLRCRWRVRRSPPSRRPCASPSRKFSAGSATKFDVLTTQVRLANARNHLTDTSPSLEKQENGLRQLLGWDLGTPLDLAGDFDAEAPAISESAAISDGLLNRPEMKVARDNEQTARLQLDAADRGNRPTLAAQVAGGVENGVVPNLYDNRGYLTAGLSLEVPIFTGKRVMGERMEAGAGVRSAQARERELNEDDHDRGRRRLLRPERRPRPARERRHAGRPGEGGPGAGPDAATPTASSPISSCWTPRAPQGRRAEPPAGPLRLRAGPPGRRAGRGRRAAPVMPRGAGAVDGKGNRW